MSEYPLLGLPNEQHVPKDGIVWSFVSGWRDQTRVFLWGDPEHGYWVQPYLYDPKISASAQFIRTSGSGNVERASDLIQALAVAHHLLDTYNRSNPDERPDTNESGLRYAC